MNIKEISEKLGLSFLNEAEPSKEVEGGYCGDLLSFVMSHAKCGDCWFTVMGNVNAVAVAVLSDCAAIVLCESSTLDGDALEKAKEQGVNILSSAEDAFSLSVKLSGLL